jgi:hypothetical protein
MVGGGHDVRPENIEVSLQSKRRPRADNPAFDITFRACLPKDTTVDFEGEQVSGDEFNLVVSMQVLHDQITQRSPDIRIGAPMIERAPSDAPFGSGADAALRRPDIRTRRRLGSTGILQLFAPVFRQVHETHSAVPNAVRRGSGRNAPLRSGAVDRRSRLGGNSDNSSAIAQIR